MWRDKYVWYQGKRYKVLGCSETEWYIEYYTDEGIEQIWISKKDTDYHTID